MDDTTTTLNRAVASEIRAWMGRRQLTGRQLAARMGKTQTWTATRVRGEQEISLSDLERFADALEVQITDLIPAGAPAGKPRGGSLRLVRPTAAPARTDEPAVGRGTPALANPPTTTPIARPTGSTATAGRHHRPVRLSRPAADGEAR